MTQMQVKASETGLVRLFAIDLPVKEALRLKNQPNALAAVLGIEALDMDHVEIFELEDLVGLGLESYLNEGHGVEENQLSAVRWQLDALEGAVMLLRSSAIVARPATLQVQTPLRWIATFGEAVAPVPMTGLSTPSAQGTLGAPAQAPGPRGSLWALGLALLLTAAVAITVWLVLA
ncbi:hypothetical protein ACS3SW_17995 [Roseobacteraceae bacterium S113]